ncbi:hypothetical protein [Pukyongiella litopenaei]|uniref:Uncharacterized protein n=1 Tax=Pukyongiella litopenaei TaxID=2605946 RepID=A0A2S0MMH1_9RHOB|nr:hypothetical protein [Pukyongiella litopenaei]AVO37085.2 hypothetical protein C6Y53_04775 [Pukyongiella litopenaei]
MTGQTAIVSCLLALGAVQPGQPRAPQDMEAIPIMASDEQTLAGLTLEQAEIRFGTPSDSDEFALAPELPEFRNDLPGLFDEADIRAGVQIRERTWSYSDSQNITLWFAAGDGAWRAVHHMIWDKGLEF